MVTILLVFCIFILLALSVYLFFKAEQEVELRRQRKVYLTLDREAVLISTIQQGKVQETWCYINDIRSRFKQANVIMENAPATIDGVFNK